METGYKTLIGAVAATALLAGSAAAQDSDEVLAMSWDDIVAAADGGTVNWFMWGGSDTINAYVSESDLDTEHTSLALKWSDERGWHVAGVYETKEIETTLNHEGGVDSMLTDALALKYALEPHGDLRSITLNRCRLRLGP